jgi:hypothetical protein
MKSYLFSTLVRKSLSATICAVGLCSPLTQELYSQGKADYIGTSMANANTAYSSGTSALFTNPANLISTQNTGMELSIGSVGIMAGNSMMSLSEFNYYFGGVQANGRTQARTLNNEERDVFLQKFDGGRVASQVDIAPIAFTMPLSSTTTIGAAIYTTVQGNMIFPEQFSVALSGSAGAVPLSLSDISFSAMAYSAYQVSVAHEIFNSKSSTTTTSIRSGVSIKYLQGLYYSGSGDNQSITLTPFTPAGFDSTKSWAMNVRSRIMQAGTSSELSPAMLFGSGSVGSGIGFDIGTTVSFTDNDGSFTNFSIAITDVGSIGWKGKESVINVNDTLSGVANVNQTYFDRYQPKESATDFTTSLPMRLRIGTSNRWANILGEGHHITGVFEYTQGLNCIGANTQLSQVGIGAEISQSGFIPAFRAGLRIGGFSGTQITTGLGWMIYNTVGFNLSLGSITPVLSSGSTSWIDGGCGIVVRL